MKRHVKHGRMRRTKLRQRQRQNSPIERIFRRWLASSRRRLRVPLQVVGRSGSSLRLRFTGITPDIEVHLRYGELGVVVTHDQQFWDFIQLFEIDPQRQHGVYACRLCPPAGRKTYFTLASLLRAHTFEPFLTWANDSLFQAQWLCLQCFAVGATEASLMVEESQVLQRIGKYPGVLTREHRCDGSIQFISGTDISIELLPIRTS